MDNEVKEVAELTIKALIGIGEDRLKKFVAERREKKRRGIYREAELARLNPTLIEILKTYYHYQLLERAGLSYPVTAISCPRSQETDVDSILGTFQPKVTKTFPPHNDYLQMLTEQGKKIWNGRTYVLDGLIENNLMKIDCSLGWYNDALATCDSLEWELLSCLATKPSRLKSIRRTLKQRNQLQSINRDPVHNGSARSAALSVSTLIVFNDGKKYRALLRWRSNKTAAHADLYHVVPSGMFQPQYGYVDSEYSVSFTIWREYLEEICGVKEMDSSSGELDITRVTRDPRIVRLHKLLASKKAELLLTGFAVNLLNLRPEICTLLLIHDTQWLSQKVVSNWEFANNAFLLDIGRTDSEIGVDLASIPGTFVPPGAAAFWLGVDCARRHIMNRRRQSLRRTRQTTTRISSSKAGLKPKSGKTKRTRSTPHRG